MMVHCCYGNREFPRVTYVLQYADHSEAYKIQHIVYIVVLTKNIIEAQWAQSLLSSSIKHTACIVLQTIFTLLLMVQLYFIAQVYYEENCIESTKLTMQLCISFIIQGLRIQLQCRVN